MNRHIRNYGPGILAVALALAGVVSVARSAEEPVLAPPPVVDEALPARDGAHARETAVLSGGCFWGVQKVFQHVKGVEQAVSGYAGGAASTAEYEMVSTGSTGHAESVRITFDPAVVSYGTILRIFFSVAHDPTQLNRQGPDTGSQYRSEIFTLNDEQARVARNYVLQLDRAGVFPGKIVTRIDPLAGFFPAEAHHQDYATRHPDSAYIVYNDLPKVRHLEELFPQQFRSTPVLVAAGH